MAATTQCVVCHRQVDLPDGVPPNELYRCPQCVAAGPAPVPKQTEDASPVPSSVVPTFRAERPSARTEVPLKVPDLVHPDRGTGPTIDPDVAENFRLGVTFQLLAHLVYLIGLSPIGLSYTAIILHEIAVFEHDSSIRSASE